MGSAKCSIAIKHLISGTIVKARDMEKDCSLSKTKVLVLVDGRSL